DLLSDSFGDLRIAVAGQVRECDRVANRKQIDTLGPARGLTSPRQTLDAGQRVQQRALADVGAAGQGDFKAIPSRAVREREHRGDEFRVKLHRYKLRLVARADPRHDRGRLVAPGERFELSLQCLAKFAKSDTAMPIGIWRKELERRTQMQNCAVSDAIGEFV